MTETETEHHPQGSAEAAAMAERVRRLARWTMTGLGMGVVAIIVGAVSLGVWARSAGAEGDRNSWDDARRANETCVTQSTTRADTILLEHARYDREATGIDDDEATIDLIEANVMGLIAFANLDPASAIVRNSVDNIARRRERLEQRRVELAAARVEFDEKRPPLDVAACPPAPSGPRP